MALSENSKKYHRDYLRRYNKTAIGFLRLKYIKMLQRVRGHNGPKDHNYVGLEILGRESFLIFASHDPTFWRLWNQYRESGWRYGMCPSIDRLDQDKGYTLDNIQFITMQENQIRGREKQWRNRYDQQQGEGRPARAGSEGLSRGTRLDGLQAAPQGGGDDTHKAGVRPEDEGCGHIRLRHNCEEARRADQVDTGRRRGRKVKKGETIK